MTNGRSVLPLTINLLIYRIFTRIPVMFFQNSGSAAALTALYSGLIALGIICLFGLVGKCLNVNIVEAARGAFGKVGSYTITVVVLIYLFISGIVALENAARLTLLISFPDSPLYFAAALLALGAVCGALGGRDAVLRLHRLFVPIVLIVTGLTIASTLFRGDEARLTPILGKGAEAVFGKGLSGVFMYTDIILLLLLNPCELDTSKCKKTVMIGTVIGVAVNFATVLAFNLNLPERVLQDGKMPMYLLMKEVYYGRFFQRIDAILLFGSGLSYMLYLALNIFLFSDAAAKGFGFARTKALVLGYALAVFVSVLGFETAESISVTRMMFISAAGVAAILALVVIFARRGKSRET